MNKSFDTICITPYQGPGGILILNVRLRTCKVYCKDAWSLYAVVAINALNLFRKRVGLALRKEFYVLACLAC